VAAGPRPVQGLHRDAEVQHVPVAAHDGHRARGQAGRAADPHALDAPHGPSTASPRTGSTRKPSSGVSAGNKTPDTSAGRTTWPGCASCWTGSARRPTPASSSTRCASTWRLRGLRLHAEGRRHPAALGLDAGGLRVRGAHRGRPPLHRRPGQRQAGALESKLDNGDVVEIFTSKAENARAEPGLAGLRQASPRARNKIRAWFTKERREEAIEQGREQIAKAIRKQGLPLQRLLSSEALSSIALDLHYADISALYAAVGENHVSAQSIVQRLLHTLGGEEGAEEDLAESTLPTLPGDRRERKRAAGDPGVLVKGVEDVWVKLSRCCTPVPGDSIMGFVTRGNGVSVHRADCTNIESLKAQPERMLAVEWAPTASSVFLVSIQIEALDRARLLSDVTRVLSDQHVNILSATVNTSRNRVATSRFTFEMGDPKHLGHVLKAVRGIEGVYDVYRV
jgi:hypothetical protein